MFVNIRINELNNNMLEGFDLGPLFIRYDALILLGGILAGAFLTVRLAGDRGFEPGLVWDIFIQVVFAGLIGARVWHILTPPPSSGVSTNWYLKHPLDMLAIWRGGLGIVGAIVGGSVALFLISRRLKLDFSQWGDIIAPGLALGQAIGRWGDFINQQIYGLPTKLPWGIFIDQANRLEGFLDFETYHPLFFYESMWNFLNLVILLWIFRLFAGKLRNGDIFLSYLVVYSAGRFFLEFLRIDVPLVWNHNINQSIMAIVAVISGVALYLRHRKD